MSTHTETGLRPLEHRRPIRASPEVAPTPLHERRATHAPRVREGGIGWLTVAFVIGAISSYAVFAAVIYLAVTAVLV
jgi:hypothetical protein